MLDQKVTLKGNPLQKVTTRKHNFLQGTFFLFRIALPDDSMEMILKSSWKELKDIAYRLLSYAGDHRIWLLEGPMGSGKTTLIKELCGLLKTVHMVNSPTFAIINEYETIDHTPIYHFDCYRLNNIDDAIALDFESYFASGCYCFIEWPSKIAPILPLHYFLITIEIKTSTSRNLICRRYS